MRKGRDLGENIPPLVLFSEAVAGPAPEQYPVPSLSSPLSITDFPHHLVSARTVVEQKLTYKSTIKLGWKL